MGRYQGQGPTHAIKVAYQVGKQRRWVSKEVGVAFAEDDGSFTLKIHRGMALFPQEGVTCKAWPIDEGKAGGGRRGGGQRQSQGGDEDYDGGDEFPGADF